jgi:hypothetical protein
MKKNSKQSIEHTSVSVRSAMPDGIFLSVHGNRKPDLSGKIPACDEA